MPHNRLLKWVVLASAFGVACSSAPEVISAGTGDELPVAVPLGKEDNFYSTSAREYLVEGRATVVLDDEDVDRSAAEKLKAARRLVPFKQTAIAWFMNAWVVPKDKGDPNASYGGFNALAKNALWEDLELEAIDERTYEFNVLVEVSGSLDLMDRLPITRNADGSADFDLAVGLLSNGDLRNLGAGDEWFRKAPWDTFVPSTVPDFLVETIPLRISPIPRSPDAWMDTARLFEDGEVDIAVHFGWDYHDASHIKESRILFDWLVDHGYRAPESSWDDLTPDSGPFTRRIVAGGEPVDVSIYVYFGKPGTGWDPETAEGGARLKKDAIFSLENREVVIYSGHSGPFWGFSMGNWKKTDAGELDDNEIAALDLPDSYQLVLAEGCETYAMGNAFFTNPAKSGRDNVDVVTTSTYSTAFDAEPVRDFLTAVVGTDEDGHHVPVTVGELLRDLDYNAWEPAMYGLQGVDDNPHLHPYAEPEYFCEPCSWESDCGELGGGICLRLGTDGQFCSAECTTDSGCPDGFICAAVARGQSITSRACVPQHFSCTSDVSPTRVVIINEILADPPNGPDGDLNEDGYYDAGEDEFVELVNVTGRSVDMSGWTLSDGLKVRFTVPAGVLLEPGAAMVVFGGGDPTAVVASTGALGFAAPEGLQLANRGDSVILRRDDGRVVDRVVYGAQADQDRSLNREKDSDADAGWVAHPGTISASPGTATDLSLF